VNTTTFQVLSNLISDRMGIVIREDKEYLLEARLMPICREHGLSSIDQLAAAVNRASAKGIVDEILDAMTTNETSFFRDGAPYELLVEQVLPRIIENRRKERHIRIWSAASSSGQEIYTVSMVMAENFPELQGWKVDLVATDVSPSMIKRCEAGAYTRHEISRGLTDARVAQHFIRASDNEFIIDPRLKRGLVTRLHNLQEPFVGEDPFDLVLLRNVLIYFSTEVRAQVLDNIAARMRPDGVLMMGTAETPMHASFQRSSFCGTSFFSPVPEGGAGQGEAA